MIQIPWFLPLRRPDFVFYKLRFRLPTYFPPYLRELFIFGGIFYIFSGGIYNQIKHPKVRDFDEKGNPILLYPDLNRQYLLEGYAAGLLIFLGVLGLYLLIEATRDPHNVNRAFTFQLMSIMMLVLAVLIVQNMWFEKCVEANLCEGR